jgi:RNA polymerase sigma-70 factor (ECF subfamily)
MTTLTHTDSDGPLAEEPWVAPLVMSARDGNERAFRRLYGEFAPRVYRFCRFRVTHAADAEDLTQQTFLKAVQALPRYEDRGLPFAAWLFRIARNVVIDFERRRREEIDLDDVIDRDPATISDPRVVRPDDSDALIRAIGELTKGQRDVLTYRFFADLSVRETGLLIGRNEASVRALQARALGALRRRLERSSQRDVEMAAVADSDTRDRRLGTYILHPLSQRP